VGIFCKRSVCWWASFAPEAYVCGHLLAQNPTIGKLPNACVSFAKVTYFGGYLLQKRPILVGDKEVAAPSA